MRLCRAARELRLHAGVYCLRAVRRIVARIQDEENERAWAKDCLLTGNELLRQPSQIYNICKVTSHVRGLLYCLCTNTVTYCMQWKKQRLNILQTIGFGWKKENTEMLLRSQWVALFLYKLTIYDSHMTIWYKRVKKYIAKWRVLHAVLMTSFHSVFKMS